MFEKTCDYCGATMRVMDTQQEGHNEYEDYYCPECNKRFRTYASLPPTVTLLTGRTDNRTDQYQNPTG
ncbi:hypothetical protein [Chitinolyticbacter albus]|uniref:hypothetical protein n=1 Tax=Chitinolyticbacter albus TaxID=2961951 RepID=UPI00210D4B39|nr:hypothetical protein [Chitinolyticbacter albus]